MWKLEEDACMHAARFLKFPHRKVPHRPGPLNKTLKVLVGIKCTFRIGTFNKIKLVRKVEPTNIMLEIKV